MNESINDAKTHFIGMSKMMTPIMGYWSFNDLKSWSSSFS